MLNKTYILHKFPCPFEDNNNNNNNNNNTHKLQWDFNIQSDHLIPARRPDLIIINQKKKENLSNCRLSCPGGPQNKSEGK